LAGIKLNALDVNEAERFKMIGKKKKTLPIPSGKCSMLIDKI